MIHFTKHAQEAMATTRIDAVARMLSSLLSILTEEPDDDEDEL